MVGILFTGANFEISSASPEEITYAIHKNHSTWIAMEANVKLVFESEDGPGGTCVGSLLYHRLDEKLLIKCNGPDKQAAFTLRTNDTQFDLYMPSRETIYSGNIFDLDDSKEIDSFIQPLSLYRGLKSARFLTKQLEIETIYDDLFYLKIWDTKRSGSTYLSRRMEIDRFGQVFKEVYYTQDEVENLKIERKDFKTLKGPMNKMISFSHEITMTKNQGMKKLITTLFFSNVTFHSYLNASHWQLETSSDTKQINVRSEILPVMRYA